MVDGCAVRCGGREHLCRLMLRHPFPLRDQPHRIEFIQGMGRGVERVVETEGDGKGKERSRGQP